MERKKKPNILCVITARGGSKGLPGKNIKMLGGKPLIAYSIDAAQKSDLITRTIISTDDEEIASIAKEWGGDVPFMRPKELAQDDTPHLPVMQHAITAIEEIDGVIYDYILIFQPTSPFRTPEHIDGAIKKLIETGADSLISVCRVDDDKHPAKMKTFDGDVLMPVCEHFAVKEGTRRQEFQELYRRDSSIFVMPRATFMEKKSLYGESTAGYIVPRELAVDTDSPLDWVFAEALLVELQRRGYEF